MVFVFVFEFKLYLDLYLEGFTGVRELDGQYHFIRPDVSSCICVCICIFICICIVFVFVGLHRGQRTGRGMPLHKAGCWLLEPWCRRFGRAHTLKHCNCKCVCLVLANLVAFIGNFQNLCNFVASFKSKLLVQCLMTCFSALLGSAPNYFFPRCISQIFQNSSPIIILAFLAFHHLSGSNCRYASFDSNPNIATMQSFLIRPPDSIRRTRTSKGISICNELLLFCKDCNS